MYSAHFAYHNMYDLLELHWYIFMLVVWSSLGVTHPWVSQDAVIPASLVVKNDLPHLLNILFVALFPISLWDLLGCWILALFSDILLEKLHSVVPYTSFSWLIHNEWSCHLQPDWLHVLLFHSTALLYLAFLCMSCITYGIADGLCLVQTKV